MENLGLWREVEPSLTVLENGPDLCGRRFGQKSVGKNGSN